MGFVSHIRILPDNVANQIAAGEVVERPVAVVKELVENAIDASATRINVEFQRGGKSYIKVEDNGSGMAQDEAILALERHATSKIRSAADLSSVSTMGFRGEALPSIASVSRFKLRTRSEAPAEGAEIFINGGKWIETKACGMPQGTVIEVSQLFNSVPVRRKFLKTDRTEAAHIVQLMRLYALVHPEIKFSLKEDGRLLLKSPNSTKLEDRIASIWARSLAGELLPLGNSTHDNIRLIGAIGRPGLGRSTRHDIQCFVNKRPVESRTLSYAITEAYHTHLPKGRYPAAFLFLQINPADVDVNVHPSKKEIRFQNESEVRRFVLNSILNCLERKPVQAEEKPHNDAPTSTPPEISTRAAPLLPQENPSTHTQAPPASTTAAHHPPKLPSGAKEKVHAQAPPETSPSSQKRTPKLKLDWRYIGLFKSKRQYALFETPQGLYMLYCRAAHERTRYEELCTQFKAEKVMTQALLLPFTIEFDPITSSALEPWIDFLNQRGIGISAFGRHFFRVEYAPSWMDIDRIENFVKDLAASIREGEIDLHKQELAQEKIALLASTQAIQINHHPSEQELRHLLQNLMACRYPHVCPKGRPTYVEMRTNEIEKKFGLSGLR